MALIGKIRAKSGLAVGIVGGALVLFILADAFKGIFTPDVEPTVYASVYGEPIDINKVNQTEQLFLQNSEIQAQRQGKSLTNEDRDRVKEQAFQEEIRKIIMGRQMEALGIEVNAEELNFLVKGDGTLLPSRDIQNIFRDSLGNFSMQALNNFLTRLPNLEPEGKQQWADIEKNLKDSRKTEKYVSLIARSLYVTDFEAKRKYNQKNETKQIQFVLKRYTEGMNDSTNNVSDDELRTYYEAHKNEKKYEQKMARKFTYIQIPFAPSDADFVRYERNLKRLKRAFVKTANDSSFVVKNSDNKVFNPEQIYSVGAYNPQNPNAYPASIGDSIDAASIGDVVGPYRYGPTMCIAKKIANRKQNLAWVRHILVKIDTVNGKSQNEAKQLSDSLISVIKANDNFVDMVTQFSEDQGSIYNGGEYKWFPEGQMVPTFNDAAFNGAIGSLQLVKTTYGYHIVEVLGRKDEAPVLAVIQKTIKAGDAASDAAYDESLALMSVLYEKKDDFSQIAQDSNYLTKDGYVSIENPKLFNINKGDQSILKFCFSNASNEGDISSPILIDEGMYGIFQLTGIIEEGAPSFETVKEQLRFEAKKEKIAKKFIANMSNKKTLEEVASAIGSEVSSATVNFESTNIQGAGGNEPAVVGAIFSGLQKGQLTIPIEGSTGVYVVLVTNVIAPQETTDFSAAKAELNTGLKQNVSSEVYQGLYQQADIKDDRKKIEYGAK